MIFVTVGHQMPFDRMIRVVDQWAGANPGNEIFAQTGKSEYEPVNIKYTATLTPREFDKKMGASNIVIAHAGTGTIIKALELNKPIFVMPRKAVLLETRNDHQIHTVDHFSRKGYVRAFNNEAELDYLFSHSGNDHGVTISRFATDELINTVSKFIHGAGD